MACYGSPGEKRNPCPSARDLRYTKIGLKHLNKPILDIHILQKSVKDGLKLHPLVTRLSPIFDVTMCSTFEKQ